MRVLPVSKIVLIVNKSRFHLKTYKVKLRDCGIRKEKFL